MIAEDGKPEGMRSTFDSSPSGPSPTIICPEYTLCHSFRGPRPSSKNCTLYDEAQGECKKYNRCFGIRRSIRATLMVMGEQSTTQLARQFDLSSSEVKRLMDRDVRLKLLSSYNRESDNVLMWGLHNGDRIYRTKKLKEMEDTK